MAISRTLSRRLGRLEELIVHISESKVWQIVYLDSDGNRRDGERIEWSQPRSGSTRQPAVPAPFGNATDNGYYLAQAAIVSEYAITRDLSTTDGIMARFPQMPTPRQVIRAFPERALAGSAAEVW